jgi:tetracycline repressor-like protein
MLAWLQVLFDQSPAHDFDSEALTSALFGALNALATFIARSTDAKAAHQRARLTLSQLLQGLQSRAQSGTR